MDVEKLLISHCQNVDTERIREENKKSFRLTMWKIFV